MQIVNTKLPNENIQTYQPEIINSGGGVNYQIQIVIKLPNGTTKVAQNDSEQPILPNSQLFQSFPTEVVQNDSEWPISPNSNFSNLFPLKWLRMIWNGQIFLICNFSNLFPLKWLRMTQNGEFHLIHNFANLSPLEWLRMTWNGQFCLIHNFSNLFPPNDQFQGVWVNDQMQIVNTKLPNENIQFYQLQMIDSGGNYPMQIVIKLPNGTTKVAQNDSEQPILPNSQLFQSLPTTETTNCKF